MDTYLITGAAGFIGSSLAKELLLQGKRVVALDNFCNGNKAKIEGLIGTFSGQLILKHGDIRDLEFCKEAASGADYILHHAALASVPQSIVNPKLFQENNETGTLNMLLAAKEAQVNRFVFASSSAIYGDSEVVPISETAPLNPKSPYALNKLMGEYYASFFYQQYGLPTIGLRYFNVFGPGQDPHGPYAAVIPLFIQAMREGKAPVIYGDGKQTRDFIFIDNVVAANLAACEASSDAFGKSFNVGTGRATSVNELVSLIKSLTHYSGDIAYKPIRNGDILDSVSDPSLSHTLLNQYEKVAFEEGIRRTVAQFFGSPQ